jgi:hypothetical protein
MFSREGAPPFDPGVCFICELAPTDGFVDTLREFDAGYFNPLNGRKVVCLSCVTGLADAIGWSENKSAQGKLKASQAKLAEAGNRIDAALKALSEPSA